MVAISMKAILKQLIAQEDYHKLANNLQYVEKVVNFDATSTVNPYLLYDEKDKTLIFSKDYPKSDCTLFRSPYEFFKSIYSEDHLTYQIKEYIKQQIEKRFSMDRDVKQTNVPISEATLVNEHLLDAEKYSGVSSEAVLFPDDDVTKLRKNNCVECGKDIGVLSFTRPVPICSECSVIRKLFRCHVCGKDSISDKNNQVYCVTCWDQIKQTTGMSPIIDEPIRYPSKVNPEMFKIKRDSFHDKMDAIIDSLHKTKSLLEHTHGVQFEMVYESSHSMDYTKVIVTFKPITQLNKGVFSYD